ncbi:MAG: hypothetical protein WAT79_13505 [Saprospiraceae bacterium]
MKSKKLNSMALIWLFVMMMTTFFFSCEKEKDPLEACRKDPTCEYFVCKVNGERWEPQCNRDPLFGCTPWDVQYYRNTSGNLGMYIRNESLSQNFTLLTRNQILKIGDNELFTNENIQTRFSNLNNMESCVRYELDTLKFSSLYISKIDTINYYLSGTFNFTGKNDCGEEVKITDGEFNLSYRF